MAVGRHTHASLVIHDKILVIGGVARNDDVQNSVELFNPDTNEWTRAAPMHERRSAFQTGVINTYVYVFGGSGGNDDFPENLMSIEKYCILDDKWTLVS